MAAATILDILSLTTFDLCDIHLCVIYQVGGFECVKVNYNIHFEIQALYAA